MKNKTKVTLSAMTLAISTLLMLNVNAEEYPVKQVSEGIYYHQGVQEDANRDNKGEIANTGFIIGEKCIAVVDTGGSYLEGKSLFAAIRDKSDLPICYVINTHAHPDHFLGNAAFKETEATFIGNDKMPAAIEARRSFYETRFSDILGPHFEGTEFIEPTQLVSVDNPIIIDLGERELVLTSYPTSHTDNDLTVLDKKTKTLWTGDLLFVKRIPALDGSINGWLSTIEALKSMKLNTVIPGHGPAQHEEWQQAFDDEAHYFSTIREQIRAIIYDMGTINEATESVGLSEKGKWLLFDDYHKRNITAAFTELEWE